MTAPAPLTLTITGRKADGTPLGVNVAARLQGAIGRTIGTAGDSLVVIVQAASWRPVDLDISKPMSVTFGITGSTLTLGGYLLREEVYGTFGVAHPDDSEGVVPLEVMLRFVTLLGAYRDGRGGVLQEQTYNPLKPSGLVDDAHADYRTNSALANLAMSAVGIDYTVAPSSMNIIDPPAPLDWGNCRALPELDALCARTGHAVVLNNAGDEISIVRLPLAGEDVTVPSLYDSVVQPYYLSSGPAIRPNKLIVTSGRTRSTIVTDRTLDSLEWVWKDSRTGRWLNDAQTASLYSGETQPGDIDAFKDGPPKDQAKRGEFKRLFSALRFKDEEIDNLKRLVNFPDQATLIDGTVIAGDACIVYAKCSFEVTSGQLANADGGEGAKLRIDGARAVAGEGVFILPDEALMVRMSPGPTGNYGTAIELTDSDVQILFAHEANTGEPTDDYFIVGYKGSMSGGSVDVDEMTEEELADALLDPATPVLAHDWLQRLLIWPNGEGDPTASNDADLKTAAEKIAKVRMAGSYAKNGVVTLRGIIDIEPGAWGGFVSGVQWDLYRQLTIVSVGQHEVPDGVIDAIESAARRSFVAGYGRFSLPGSAVELSEVRSGGGPGVLSQMTSAAAPGDARGTAATRGSEKSQPPTTIGESLSPLMDRQGDAGEFLARITGNSSAGTNKWTYTWEEVYLKGDGTYATSGRTSATHGVAVNGAEAGNSGSGVQGNGVDLANLPAEFEIKPIATGGVHQMLGPFGDDETRVCWFKCPNAVDGACE